MPSPTRRLAALALVAWLLLPVPLALAQQGTAQPEVTREQVREVTDQLICQCGCNMLLSECNHQNCPFAIPEREAIAKRLAAGETPDQIVASYVRDYGRGILAEPTTQGFDLLAWITPIAALLVGTVIVLALVRQWRKQGEQPAAGGGDGEPADPLLKRIEAELKEEPR